ncbi:MAG TPA: cbb3-type cytochrome c oxidase subunit I [Chthoniobacterales bacterium]|nr:cbb3-type cytochrome c oxidase subunit I [Chthoniobacterales bacterium]
MNSISRTQSTINLTEPAPLHSVTRAAIDGSLRFPMALWVRGSVFWLLVGSLLSLVAAFKLVVPSFLDGPSFLTYGRLFPVATDLLLYGWATQLGIGVSLWLMARLCGSPLRHTSLLTCAIILWNVAIFLGSLAILCGYSTSVEWLEYPNWASFLLFLSFLLIGVWVVLLFSVRQSCVLYVSQWYLLAAFCSFPWIYATANRLLTWGVIEGSAQGPIHWWYGGNLINLWFTPLALGLGYYIIPKITGGIIANYYLAILGFFSLLLFAAWSGSAALIGGPIPAWMMSAGVVATVLMMIPMVAVVLNFYKMLQGHYVAIVESPALRFTVVGIISYIIFTTLSFFNAIPSFNATLHFTDYTSGRTMLALLGFLSMILFGAIYYILPRLTGIEWPSSSLIRWHFWLATVGVSLMIFSMIFGGVIEGIALEDAAISFVNVLSYAAPWRWLVVFSWILLLFSYGAFARLLLTMRWEAASLQFKYKV